MCVVFYVSTVDQRRVVPVFKPCYGDKGVGLPEQALLEGRAHCCGKGVGKVEDKDLCRLKPPSDINLATVLHMQKKVCVCLWQEGIVG